MPPALDLSKLAELIPFLGRKKPIQHELKWKIPESRLSSPVEDAEKTVASLRKLSKFVSGGQYIDAIYSKDFGEGVLAYFIVRTDRNTEKETLLFDGYMVQEEDEKLDVDLTVSFEMMKNLSSMGYRQEISRDITEWNFAHLGLAVSVYDVTDFGSFVQVSVPATKFEKTRESSEKNADALFDKLKISKKDVIPTDVITLQVMMGRQQGAPPKGRALGGGAKFALGENKD